MAHETLTISNRLETLPNRDAITKIRFLFDKEGSGLLEDDHDASVPVASSKLWLERKDEGNQCFRARDIKGALIAYDAAARRAAPLDESTTGSRRHGPWQPGRVPRRARQSVGGPRGLPRGEGVVELYSARSGSMLMR